MGAEYSLPLFRSDLACHSTENYLAGAGVSMEYSPLRRMRTFFGGFKIAHVPVLDTVLRITGVLLAVCENCADAEYM